MFELMVLIGLVFGLGLAILATWIVLLSIYVLFRFLGFAVKASIASIFLLPLVLLTGAIFFFNVVIIGMPLLIAFVLFRSLVGHFRRDEPDTFIVQTLPPDSS